MGLVPKSKLSQIKAQTDNLVSRSGSFHITHGHRKQATSPKAAPAAPCHSPASSCPGPRDVPETRRPPKWHGEGKTANVRAQAVYLGVFPCPRCSDLVDENFLAARQKLDGSVNWIWHHRPQMLQNLVSCRGTWLLKVKILALWQKIFHWKHRKGPLEVPPTTSTTDTKSGQLQLHPPKPKTPPRAETPQLLEVTPNEPPLPILLELRYPKMGIPVDQSSPPVP